MLILLEDLLEEFLQKIFGEEIGGVRGTPTPLLFKALQAYEWASNKRWKADPSVGTMFLTLGATVP